MILTQDIIDRFWSKVNIQGQDDCWNWIGAMNVQGYGVLKIKGTHHRSNRLSWIIHNDSIPDRLFVCHTCDNRACVNPRHLFLGTHRDNTDDMLSKNRQAKGEKSGPSKLVADQVLEIRRIGSSCSQAELSKRFNVSIMAIRRILSRKNWRHV